MDISRFFIDRPRFAAVLSIFIFLIGSLAIFQLPLESGLPKDFGLSPLSENPF